MSKRSRAKLFSKAYIREIIFGFEDSFVSTVGALTGIAAGAGDRSVVILAGLVVIVVEATSMAAGSYLSNKAEQYVSGEKQTQKRPIVGGAVMGLSYMTAGVFPLLPYLFFPLADAVLPSILLTVMMLFGVGAWLSRLSKRPIVHGGLEMMLVAGAAILLGFLVGRGASMLLGISI